MSDERKFNIKITVLLSLSMIGVAILLYLVWGLATSPADGINYNVPITGEFEGSCLVMDSGIAELEVTVYRCMYTNGDVCYISVYTTEYLGGVGLQCDFLPKYLNSPTNTSGSDGQHLSNPRWFYGYTK